MYINISAANLLDFSILSYNSTLVYDNTVQYIIKSITNGIILLNYHINIILPV